MAVHLISDVGNQVELCFNILQHSGIMRGLKIAPSQPRNSKESNSRMSIESRKFRDDINGLRAWAVIAVVLYHFGVLGFSGGFVGVDIFFAISGFLMTGIVVNGLEKNRQSGFSVLDFYMARARRILPALVVLCVFLLVAGWLLLLPLDYKMLGLHSLFSVFFLSNMKFWREAGYFDTQSHEKWLLHTWSLAVEWQFYLLLPLAIVTIWKLSPGRKSIFTVLASSLFFSLALSITTTPTNPSAAFYLLPTRAWEMLAGGLIFLLANRWSLSQRTCFFLEAIGFGLIIGSIIGFDSSSSWPGWRALVPVTGTCLILLAARSDSRWTSPSWMQWTGTRSYSIYLWHWPIVVALTYAAQQNNVLLVLTGIMLTLFLGHLSYHLIESPSRKYLSRISFNKSAATLTLSTLLVAGLGLSINFKQGINGRFDPALESISQEYLNRNPRRDECILVSGFESPSCTFGGDTLKAIVIGDSHAEAVVSAVSAAGISHAPNSAVMEWSYNACPTLQGVHNFAREQCGQFVDWAINKLEFVPKNVPVIIINRHAQYALGNNENKKQSDIPQVYFSKPYATPEIEFLKEYSQHLINTACTIAKERPVYLVRPFPEMGTHVPNSMARPATIGTIKNISLDIASYHKRQDFIWRAQDIARDKCGIKILNPLPYLCSEKECFGAKNNRPLYLDDNHLSEHGNKTLVPMFVEVFRDSDIAPTTKNLK